LIDRDKLNIKGISNQKEIMTKKIETYKDKVNILVESGFKINNLSDRK
jgi:hypothetical protein